MSTIDKLDNSFKENKYKLLSKEYVDEQTKLEISCLKHNHKSEISWKNFKRAKNKNCKECQQLYPELKTKRTDKRSKKITESVIKNTMLKFGLIIDDFKLNIKPSRTNIPFICEDGHESVVRFNVIKNHIKLILESSRYYICKIGRAHV